MAEVEEIKNSVMVLDDEKIARLQEDPILPPDSGQVNDFSHSLIFLRQINFTNFYFFRLILGLEVVWQAVIPVLPMNSYKAQQDRPIQRELYICTTVFLIITKY